MTTAVEATMISDPEPVWIDVDDPAVPAPTLDPSAEVDALASADRHLEAVARLRHEADTLQAVYERRISDLHDRLAERLAILDRQIDWHLTPVRQLHERLQEIDPTRKTLELPHGTLRLRVPTAPQVFIDDQAVVVAWAKTSAPELLPPPDRVKVTDLRKAFPATRRMDGTLAVLTANGEIVPGVHAEVPQPTWNADTAPGDAL